MRVAIVGMGAVGGLIAARLAAHGVDVCALARGATLQALRSRGLRFIDAKSPEAPPVRHDIVASDDPAALGTADIVVVAVKAPALAAVAPAVASLCGAESIIVSAMNGVPWWFFHGLDPQLAARRWSSIDPDGRLGERMPAERVIGAVLHFGASTPEPATVRLSTGVRIVLGEPAGGLSPRLDRIAALFAAAGIPIERSSRIQQDVWFKLWGNMTMNPVSALTGATADKLLDDPLVRGFLSRAMAEASEIGARIGLPIAMTPEERHEVSRHIGAFKSSMLQDVEAGRPMEIDALLGSVHEIGQVVGVPTPFVDSLFGITRLFAQNRGLYPAA